MLTTSGAGRSGVTTAKLLDFGLAKLAAPRRAAGAGVRGARGPTQAAPVTARGTILGTLQYMAPEQLEGKEADARTDLWALGAILYEMVTGRRAFEGDEPGEPDRQHHERGAGGARHAPAAHAARARPRRDEVPREAPGRPLGHRARRGRRAAVDRGRAAVGSATEPHAPRRGRWRSARDASGRRRRSSAPAIGGAACGSLRPAAGLLRTCPSVARRATGR